MAELLITAAAAIGVFAVALTIGALAIYGTDDE